MARHILKKLIHTQINVHSDYPVRFTTNVNKKEKRNKIWQKKKKNVFLSIFGKFNIKCMKLEVSKSFFSYHLKMYLLLHLYLLLHMQVLKEQKLNLLNARNYYN